MTTNLTQAPASTRRSNLRTAARVLGIVFLAIGILGFIPGITTNYDTMTFAGHNSDAKLLGIFEVSVLHNIVHLLFGIAGLALSRTAREARAYLVGGGVIYAVLWLYGLIIDRDSGANFVPFNNADNWLHLALAVVMIALGVALGRELTSTAANTGAAMPTRMR
jgi:arginine exporter protein ArgO